VEVVLVGAVVVVMGVAPTSMVLLEVEIFLQLCLHLLDIITNSTFILTIAALEAQVLDCSRPGFYPVSKIKAH
jgi:hypothetical protein